MEKIVKKITGKYDGRLTSSFRELVANEVGKLDTATSFMYLYRRFEEPNCSNKEESNILYEYKFKHEDLIVTIHASYHEFVFFGLFLPHKRFAEYFRHKRKFWDTIYKKYGKELIAPYQMLPYEGRTGLNKIQSNKNWVLLNVEFQKFFSKEDQLYIESQFLKEKPESKLYEMLHPFEKKICADFRAKLTTDEIEELKPSMPKIEQITGLKQQCLDIINEFKKGVWIRDVAINIIGYESKTNLITEYVEN